MQIVQKDWQKDRQVDRQRGKKVNRQTGIFIMSSLFPFSGDLEWWWPEYETL